MSGLHHQYIAGVRKQVSESDTPPMGEPSLAEQLKAHAGSDGGGRPVAEAGSAQQAAADLAPDGDSDPLIELKAEDYHRWLRELARVVREAKDASADPDNGHYLRPQITRFASHCQSMRSILHCCTPAETCPVCEGACCPKCGQTGFITREMVDTEAGS